MTDNEQLMNECYEKAAECYIIKDFDNAFSYLELANTFLIMKKQQEKIIDLTAFIKLVDEKKRRINYE